MFHAPVRCNRDFKLFRVLKQECQMSVHEGDESQNVFNKVSTTALSIWYYCLSIEDKCKTSRPNLPMQNTKSTTLDPCCKITQQILMRPLTAVLSSFQLFLGLKLTRWKRGDHRQCTTLSTSGRIYESTVEVFLKSLLLTDTSPQHR
jgi:hypothetical protein